MDRNEVMLQLHAAFFKLFLKNAPQKLTPYESIKPTLLFFMTSGLDLIDCIDHVPEDEKKQICTWIYSLQVELPKGEHDVNNDTEKCGFVPSESVLLNDKLIGDINASHIAMTYSCLCTLIILGDDLSRLRRKEILTALRYQQKDDGSFFSNEERAENDMRFVYCAAAICYILHDWSFINVDLLEQFIIETISYEGGFAQQPHLEAHAGSSYCAIASLWMMGRLHTALSRSQMNKLQRWLILRQISGFQGRPNKDVDTCYSFWVGAALKILGIMKYCDWQSIRTSILCTQNTRTGGFSRWTDCSVDMFHTYFGICGLSLINEANIKNIFPALNISERARENLRVIHKKWRKEESIG